MANNNKRITTSELDFDLIKQNLKNFLQGQTEFQDYDFEGSGFSILLDLLAYNTHYNALYTNLATNEAFLDSASKRANVVSIAKALGYVPDSARCSTAIVTLTVTNTTSTPNTLVLPKYTSFSSTVDGVSYNFYTMEDIITTLTGSTYTFSNVEIKEGTPLQYRYVVSEGQRYIIPNKNVDITTIKVKVQENQTTSAFEIFTNQEEILELSGDDKIYFLKEIDNELYEIEFGNGTIGKALAAGNVVTIEYMSCNTSEPNSAKQFSYQGQSLLGGTVAVSTIQAAQSGFDKEDVDTVRFNAPRAYSTQNRGVTVNDYRSIILSKFGDADSVNVWGGDENVPPVYGKVFISIKPKTTTFLTEVQKRYVKEVLLKSRNVVSITPEIVDPEYIYLAVDCTAYYNPKITNMSILDIQTLIKETIMDYNDQYLNSFDGIFRFSQFSTRIDNADECIVSNITTLKLHRQVTPKYDVLATYKIVLGNPIYFSGLPEESIVTSGFYIPGNTNIMYLEDLPVDPILKTGVFRMFYYDADLVKQYVRNIGTIDYATGTMTIEGLNIYGIADTNFEFIIKPQSNDVVSVRNQLVQIPSDTINVNVVVDKISIGGTAGNADYTFTSSRN